MPKTEMLGTEVARGQVLPEWIDINNHMNVAYYVLAFDQGVDPTTCLRSIRVSTFYGVTLV